MTLKVSANQGNKLLNYIRKNDLELKKQFRNLSTGKRLNEAADNVGRVAQVDHLEEQVRGYYRAAQNAYEGIQLARTGDAMLSEVSNLLISMRSLAVKSGSDTMSDAERMYLDEGFVAYREEVEALTTKSEVFGISYASNEGIGKQLQIENESFRPLALRLKNLSTGQMARYASRLTEHVSQSGLVRGELQINDARIRSTIDEDDRLSTSLRSASAIAKAEAINDFSEHTNVTARVMKNTRTGVNDVQGGRLDFGHELIINGAVFSGIDVDVRERDELILSINDRVGETGVLASKDANGRVVLEAEDGRNIEVITNGDAHLITGLRASAGGDVTTSRLLLSSKETIFVKDAQGVGAEAKVGLREDDIIGKAHQESVAALSINTRQGANDAMLIIDRALEELLQARAYFGGLENRLGTTVNRLNSASQNAFKAKSVIVDTDYAAETAALARNQILRESYTQMLKKSNQLPGRVLELI